MAQATLGPLQPNQTSGTALASLLRAFEEASMTLHSGNSRPGYAKPGTLWLRTSTSPWALAMFTGSSEAHLMSVNPSTGAVSLGTVAIGAVSGPLAVHGNLTVGAGQNNSSITLVDGDEGARHIHNNSGLVGFLAADGHWAMHVNDTGDLWTRKLNNIEAHIETRGNAWGAHHALQRVAKSGDTMSGDLELLRADPSVWFHYPNVKRGRWVLNSNGAMLWQDQSGIAHFYITGAGAIWTQQYGDLGTHIENRAAAYAQNGIDAANARVNEIRTVSDFVSGNAIQAGAVVINSHLASGYLTTTKAYLQIHRPDRGWSTMWRN